MLNKRGRWRKISGNRKKVKGSREGRQWSGEKLKRI
jgi:hypothetical protein